VNNLPPQTFTKRWLVARLFLGKLIGKTESPAQNEWVPIEKIQSVKGFELIWGKDSNGVIFQAFHFNKPPLFYYATSMELVEDIKYFSKISEDLDEKQG
jgi:hypothetical protein